MSKLKYPKTHEMDAMEKKANGDIAKTETEHAKVQDELKADVQKDDKDGSSDEEVFVEKKRKKKKDADPLKAVKKKKARNEVDAEESFFADL